jgi:ADP-ribose pyrophosphatase YjhB (NUDIX family)
MTDREYPARPIVGIGVVVIKGDQVLLCQRGKPRRTSAKPARKRPGAS